MVIRPGTAADISVMMSLSSSAATAAQWGAAEYEKIFRRGPVRRHCLILEENGAVQAFIVARQLEREWEIENIATATIARRRGLGTRLLGEIMAIAYSCSAREVTLEVRKSNHAARGLYQKWGFVESGRRADYYTSPIEDAIIFRFAFPKKFPEIVEAD